MSPGEPVGPYLQTGNSEERNVTDVLDEPTLEPAPEAQAPRSRPAPRAPAVPPPRLPPARPGPGALHLRLGRLGGGPGLGGHPHRRGPGPALRRLDRRRRRRAAARPARRCGRRPRAAEAHPARGRGARARRDVPGRDAVADRHRPDLAPRRGLVRHRHRHGVLLPGLLGLAPVARRRGRPPGRQRLRGDGPSHPRPGTRPGRRRRRRGGRLGRRRGVGGGRPGARRPARPDARPAHPGAPRPHDRRSPPAPWPRPSPTCARASSTWSGHRGCWPRCCSRR